MAIEISPELSRIPGDAAGIKAISDRFALTAQAIEQSVQDLRVLIQSAKSSQSDAVDALETASEGVSQRLQTLKIRYATASQQLNTFSKDLLTAQSQAIDLVSKRDEEQTTLQKVNRQLQLNTYENPEYGDEDYLNKLETNREERRVLNRLWEDTQQNLQELQRQYETVVTNLRDSGTAAARALNRAMDADGLNDGWWDKVMNWVSENAEFLKVLHEIMGWVTLVLSVLSFAFPVLAPFAFAAGALTAGLSFLLAAAGEMSWVDFALDVFGMLTLGTGAVAVKAVKKAIPLLKATRIQTLVKTKNVSTAEATRRVNLSFKGVLNQTAAGPMPKQVPSNFLELGRKYLKSFKEMLEVKSYSLWEFDRIIKGAKSGSSSADDAIIKTALALQKTHRVTVALENGVESVIEKSTDIIEIKNYIYSDQFEQDVSSILNNSPDAFKSAHNIVAEFSRLDWMVKEVVDS